MVRRSERKERYFKACDRVVRTLTGTGLKDPDAVFRVSKAPVRVKADLRVIEGIIKDIL